MVVRLPQTSFFSSSNCGWRIRVALEDSEIGVIGQTQEVRSPDLVLEGCLSDQSHAPLDEDADDIEEEA